MKLFTILISICFLVNSYAEDKQKKPNFLFVLGDDINRDSLGAYGNKDCKTPNINRLADEGMRFDKAYCSVAMCAPFRQELYSGRTPWRTGTLANHSKSHADTKSICHYLKAQGYRVALLGKSHVGPREAYPFEYLGDGSKKEDCNEFYTEKTKQFIESCQAEKVPFCLFVASHDGHAPFTTGKAENYPADKLTVPPYWLDTPELREVLSLYYAEVSNFDALVGSIYSYLEKKTILDKTLFMVCTEQGSQLPFAKWTCFDNGLHTGFIARYPSLIKPKSLCHELVMTTDVTPTLVELAGGKLKPDDCDGKSFLPLLKGEQKTLQNYVFGAFSNRNIIDNRDRVYPIRSVRSKRYSLIYSPNHKSISSNTTLTEALNIIQADELPTKVKTIAASWALKRNENQRASELVKKLFHRPEYALYDLKNDPHEQVNLIQSPEHQAVFQDLKQALLSRLAELNDSDPIETEKAIPAKKKKAPKKKPKKKNQ